MRGVNAYRSTDAQENLPAAKTARSGKG